MDRPQCQTHPLGDLTYIQAYTSRRTAEISTHCFSITILFSKFHWLDSCMRFWISKVPFDRVQTSEMLRRVTKCHFQRSPEWCRFWGWSPGWVICCTDNFIDRKISPHFSAICYEPGTQFPSYLNNSKVISGPEILLSFQIKVFQGRQAGRTVPLPNPLLWCGQTSFVLMAWTPVSWVLSEDRNLKIRILQSPGWF